MEKTYKASINMWELSTDAAHILHKKGSEDYPEIRKAMVKADYADSYKEVAVEDIPPYTKSEYDNKVAELVHERYTADEESALHRKMINAIMSPDTISADGSANKALEEYQAYNAYVQGCKERVRKELDMEN